MLKAEEQLTVARDVLVSELGHLGRSPSILGWLQPGWRDMLAYLVMRILVEAAGRTKARAEVLVAQIGTVVDWQVGFQTKDVGGRDESPAVRKRVERFRATPRRLFSGPWQVLLWDTLEIVPEQFGPEFDPRLFDLDKSLKYLASIRIDSMEDCLDAEEMLDQVRQPGRLVDFVNGNHMFVGNGSSSPRLAFEASPGGGTVGQPGCEHFDGHFPLQCWVEPFENHAHPTAADHIANFVATQFAERAGGRGLQEGKHLLQIFFWFGLSRVFRSSSVEIWVSDSYGNVVD